MLPMFLSKLEFTLLFEHLFFALFDFDFRASKCITKILNFYIHICAVVIIVSFGNIIFCQLTNCNFNVLHPFSPRLYGFLSVLSLLKDYDLIRFVQVTTEKEFHFVPNCRGSQIVNFGEKNPQVHLIIIRE